MSSRRDASIKALGLAALLIATALVTQHVYAQSASTSAFMDVQIAQAPAAPAVAPSAERIRAQAQRIKEFRDLLADRDPTVRLAALDEMLKSNDAAAREIAFEAGLGSAEPTMRALALRTRIFAMKSVVVELENRNKLPDEQWQVLMAHFGGPTHTFGLSKPDPQTGNILVNERHSGQVSGQEFTFPYNSGVFRLTLGNAGVMSGTMTNRGKSVAARVTLQ